MKPYNGRSWFWLADDGRVYGSAANEVGTADDAAYKAFIRDGSSATLWPRDDEGNQTLASMQDVVSGFSLSIPGAEADVIAPISRAQAKIQLLRTKGSAKGKTLLDDVTAAVSAAGGEVAIWFADAATWQRSNPHVAELGSTLGLSSSDIDGLFKAAAQIEA